MISMDITRRQFLVGTGVAVTGAAIPGKQADAAGLDAPGLRTKGLKKTTTICPFCAVGCGATVHVKDGTIVNIEGDEASPINQVSLCSKGQALFQVANNDQRLRKVMYRAPGSGQWEEKSWEWALERVARLMKETRRLYSVLDRRLSDRQFVADDYSIADIACYPWVLPERQSQDIDDFPHLKRWKAELRARPAVQRAYEMAKAISVKPVVDDAAARHVLFGQDKDTVR